MERSGQFWSSGDQAREYERLAREHPRRPDEGAMGYMERLAVLADPERERLILSPYADPRGVEQVRLPYRDREPGSDDE